VTPEPEELRRSLILERWRRVTNELHGGTREAAEESERWFLAVVRGADRCAHWAESSIDGLSALLVARIRRSRWRRRSARERIERVLHAEARRAGISLDEEEFAAFSERMAVLVDLVLRGALPVSCISFEEDDTPPSAEYTTGAQASAE
jgi:hypothetical protein